MEQTTGICFITGEECPVTEVFYEDKQYLVKEDLADEYPLKKIREMIANKIQEEEEKKKKALEALNTAVEALGIDKDAFQALLLGQKKEPSPPSQLKSLRKEKKDDNYVEVDGNLKADFRANINAEEGVDGSTIPGYSTVHDNDGKTVKEEGKRIKKPDKNTLVSEGNMGKTVIRIDHRSGSEIDKFIKNIDVETKELLRPAVTGRGHLSGLRTTECPLCRGSGITRIGEKKCPKCDGTGFLTA